MFKVLAIVSVEGFLVGVVSTLLAFFLANAGINASNKKVVLYEGIVLLILVSVVPFYFDDSMCPKPAQTLMGVDINCLGKTAYWMQFVVINVGIFLGSITAKTFLQKIKQ